MLTLEQLKRKYESSCNEYVRRFCKKQVMNFEGWVGDDIGGIACCNDFFFNLNDIILDINTKQAKGSIIDWYYENLEHVHKDSFTYTAINYYSYTKGLRVFNTIKKYEN